MHGYVDGAESGPNPLDRFNVIHDPARHLDPARGNTSNDKLRQIFVSLDDLMGYATDGLADRIRIHHK
jgi:hypothetical protein